MKVPLLDLTKQYGPMREEIRAAIDCVCDSQKFILGERVESFERNAASYCRVRHAVALSSGTDALLAAIMAMDIGPGDAVIVSPFTFFATIGSIVRAGAFPVFSDIDPASFNLDPERLRRALENPIERTRKYKIKAILPVHLFGQCADMDPILDLAKKHGLAVIEDAAQAIGAEYPGKNGVRKAGAIGDMGCFSFFPSKNLGCFGDGGMTITDDPELDRALRAIRVHGSTKKYIHDRVSGNFRMDALQAAILDVKLKRLESWHAARRAHAAFYDRAFKGSPVAAPRAVYAGKSENHHVYNQYVVRIEKRDLVRETLAAAGIGSEVYYPTPMHLQPCFCSLGYREGDFPESERASREVLALPIYPELTNEMQAFVAEELLKCAGKRRGYGH